MTIKDVQNEIIEEFDIFSDWMDKYQFLIDIGKNLSPLAVEYVVDSNLIQGCQSKVWLHAEFKNDKIQFTADSDAIITKGIIALLIRVLGNRTPDEIASADLFFVDRIGLSQNLSPTRANGLASMIKQMKLYAIAFQHLNKKD